MTTARAEGSFAKHGVLGLVKVAALEGAAAGLTASAVAPGWMRTPLAENQIGEAKQRPAATADNNPRFSRAAWPGPSRRHPAPR